MYTKAYTLLIANGATQSPALSAQVNQQAATNALNAISDCVIYTTVAGTVELRHTRNGAWFTYSRDGANVAFGVGASQLSIGAFADIRFVASVAVGADTPVVVMLQEGD